MINITVTLVYKSACFKDNQVISIPGATPAYKFNHFHILQVFEDASQFSGNILIQGVLCRTLSLKALN
jgi:hypothetical protein